MQQPFYFSKYNYLSVAMLSTYLAQTTQTDD